MSNENLSIQDIAAIKREIFASLHCSLPGVVMDFDSDTQTASVLPVLRDSDISLPVVHNVPVFFPGGLSSAITWPIVSGDECLLVFADYDIDSWLLGSSSRSQVESDRRHDLSDAFAFVGFRKIENKLQSFPDAPRFFGNSIYYTKEEVDTALSGKSDTGHKHAAGDITSGSLAIARGGSGQSGTSASTVIANVAVAASGCTITTAQMAIWGKVVTVRLVITKTAAVSSGTTTLATIVEGRRPRYNSPAQRQWNNGARITSAGEVQVNGAIAANESISIMSTYVMA